MELENIFQLLRFFCGHCKTGKLNCHRNWREQLLTLKIRHSSKQIPVTQCRKVTLQTHTGKYLTTDALYDHGWNLESVYLCRYASSGTSIKF